MARYGRTEFNFSYIFPIHIDNIDIPSMSSPRSNVEFTGLNIPRPIGVVQFAWGVWRHWWNPKQGSGRSYQDVSVLVVLMFDAKMKNNDN